MTQFVLSPDTQRLSSELLAGARRIDTATKGQTTRAAMEQAERIADQLIENASAYLMSIRGQMRRMEMSV